MKSTIEILAPAGSYEGMRAAMNAGCDAVYIGGSNFGARAYADNPDDDLLLKAIDEAHIRDKKLYLTVNTLLKEKELEKELYRFLENYYRQGLDAVIVQDVGVIHFIHKHFPELPIHASTQMTLTMAQGANLLKDYGVTRLVTSRELNLKEIRTIRDNTELEIETFVHGALCYCYSGQCLMSSMIGGRSGNRGRCAQPCRMPYEFTADNIRISSGQEKYLLSPKDINTLAILPELIEAGVDSFKIEGRMKRPEYAAAVSSIYRKYTDLYLEHGEEKYRDVLNSREFTEDKLVLQDVYNRGGFSEGYGRTYHGKKMMSLYRPNHSGVYVGEVKEIKGGQIGIALKEKVNAQDILEIRHKEEEGYEFTVKDPHDFGDILWTNVGRRPEPLVGNTGRRPDTTAVNTGRRPDASTGNTGRMLNISAGEAKGNPDRIMKSTNPVIHIGDSVYRTKNNRLLEFLSAEYLQKDRKLGIHGALKARAGEKLSLTIKYKDSEVTAYQDIVQEAQKQPMTKEKLSAPVLKTGDTLYYFEELEIDCDDHCFVPVAWLNEIRREALRLLEEKVSHNYRRDNVSISQEKISAEAVKEASGEATFVNKTSFGICVSIQTPEQCETALTFPEISAIYADYDTISLDEIVRLARAAAVSGRSFYLTLPQICRLAVYDRLLKDIKEIIENDDIIGFIVKNLEEVSLLQSLWMTGRPKKEIILNYNMYTYNREAKAFWREKNISHFTAPVELNYQELKALGIKDCDMVVYGYLPLMVSAQCLFESTQGCKRTNSKGRNNSEALGFMGQLTDRLGKNFYVKTNCTGCYNIIYNGQPLALYKQSEEITGLNPKNLRIDFTKETAQEVREVLSLFVSIYCYGRRSSGEIADYTTGHFKRGVE